MGELRVQGKASSSTGMIQYIYRPYHMKDVTHPSVIHIEHPPDQGVCIAARFQSQSHNSIERGHHIRCHSGTLYLFLDNNKEGAAQQYEREKKKK
mmetsp:Transcript_57765/g.64535  ORF Transcript_57765/g.64535 Transcript_57765/m.64535 type:complete len:95 (-) Transcript_57765:83-367(-)